MVFVRTASRLAYLLGMATAASLSISSSGLAQQHGNHPSYWRHVPDRWSHQNWNRTVQHNHWNRPCGGRVGCDPNSWGPQWVRPCGGLGCDPSTWSWSKQRNWRHGWYNNWSYRNWGWWGPQAAVWGIETLATAAMINAAVSSAIQANANTIDVPGSPYLLDYGSVRPGSENGITFLVSRNGQAYQMDADCMDGELNGHAPNSAAEAQLLNAACQVAFGS